MMLILTLGLLALACLAEPGRAAIPSPSLLLVLAALVAAFSVDTLLHDRRRAKAARDAARGTHDDDA